MITIQAQSAEERSQVLAERVFGAALDVADLTTIYLGDRLGFYRALKNLGEATPAELAEAAGTAERYTREWLEQQAVTGILDVTDTGEPESRRYSLPAGHDVALTDRDNLAYVAPLARQFLGLISTLPLLADAYRTGAGIPFEAYGDDLREGMGEANRVLYINLLAQEWIPALPDIDARLRDSAQPARVADIGCGTGWSTIALAQGYPHVRVDGFDLDAASIESARANAERAGVGDRVHFHVRDAADPAPGAEYDFAFAIETIHDMANPVGALAAMRRMVGAGGTVLIGDERVAETFIAPGDPIERLMYAASVLHCLPVGLSEEPSAATGTVMRPDVLRRYAEEAGFREVEVLPIENDVWRFYRLTA